MNYYDYSLVEYINQRTFVNIICPIHGIFKQIPKDHLKGCGCIKCSGKNKKSLDEFIKEGKLIHEDKYDYSKVEYINNSTKVIIICPIHGEFYQTPKIHLTKMCGCPKCGEIKRVNSRRNDFDELIEKFKIIHNNKYDYPKQEYINIFTKIKIICKKHGEF